MPRAKQKLPAKPIVVRGRLTSPRRVELDVPVEGLVGPVEVALRRAPRAKSLARRPDWFEMGRRAVARWLDENPYQRVTLAPGQVYWAAVEGRPPRPWVVVSREALNRGAQVLAIPCTTARLAERRPLRNCVSLTRGEGGVTKDCVAQAELCTSVLREELGSTPMGRLPAERWRDVVRALGFVFTSACEPEQPPEGAGRPVEQWFDTSDPGVARCSHHPQDQP